MKIKIIFLSAILIFSSCNDNEKIKEVSISQNGKNILQSIQTDSIPKIYVAVSTMISPVETFNLYKDLINFISDKLGVQIEFKQRKTYDEVNELLEKKQLDFAFICTGAYLKAKQKFPIEILAVPVVEGRPLYNAYIIVHKESGITKFEQLKGKTFAFTDPLSNTGYSYVIKLLKKKYSTPQQYFSKTIFTYAHDYSIQAVARKIVDGATVDGLVYDFLKKHQPEKVKDVIVIHKSEDYGIPPFVVQPDMNNSLKTKLKNILLNLHNDAKGKELLHKIMIDKFIAGSDALYKTN